MLFVLYGFCPPINRACSSTSASSSTTTGHQVHDFNVDEQRIGRRRVGQDVADVEPRASSNNRAAGPKVDYEQIELAATTRGLRHNGGC
ncbi:unnamed protein product [Heligmosomoides polygyrus]|uniref:Secreted protein n=1 Tax=Heligmosomoides polygyrus TaxID=6339 RepID=A0A183G9W8_HELPZ|nr:unnamed protein product [Heligmosomoides polygyrus]